MYLVNEATREEKRLQYVAGVRPWQYWLTAFIWDYGVVYMVSLPMIALVLMVFQVCFCLPLCPWSVVAKRKL